MPDERPRRNVRPELASARGRVASLTYRGGTTEEIEAARARLRSLKARIAVLEMLELPAADRMQLAGLLLTGGGDHATD